MNQSQDIRIIGMNNPYEAQFTRKILTGKIAAAFNDEYTAFAIDDKTAFVYSNKLLWNEITNIFQDKLVLKLISKPAPVLKRYLRNVICDNCHNINEYIKENGDSRLISELNREILDSDTITSPFDRVANVALIMMKYKLITDIKGKPLKSKVSHFNKKRDCYLHYLSAFNDLLVQYGPLSFSDLLMRIRSYPYLCRMSLHPAMALEGLIKVGALNNDPKTAKVSIPDQLP